MRAGSSPASDTLSEPSNHSQGGERVFRRYLAVMRTRTTMTMRMTACVMNTGDNEHHGGDDNKTAMIQTHRLRSLGEE